MSAGLFLEDGSFFPGRSFGHDGIGGGEVVFNTAMTGYQEILTDPSYAGQIVVMTYPMIGSYGVNADDVESRRIFAAGFVVREYVDAYSNFRGESSLAQYLRDRRIVAIEGVDTRALTRKIRSAGAMRAAIGTDRFSREQFDGRLAETPSMEGLDLASRVATKESYEWNETSRRDRRMGGKHHVVVVDCGVKQNILRCLRDLDVRVTVVPPAITSEELKSLEPNGILVSNGPGDPDAVQGLPQAIRGLVGKVPMLGICLGHQILGLALGAKTYKLKFGHHGANHPVRNEATGKIEITSQNHGFSVDADSLSSLDGKEFGHIKITHLHLSDGTVEGFEAPDVNVRAIQYHPEASPGPHDSQYLFEEFVGCIEKSSQRL